MRDKDKNRTLKRGVSGYSDYLEDKIRDRARSRNIIIISIIAIVIVAVAVSVFIYFKNKKPPLTTQMVNTEEHITDLSENSTEFLFALKFINQPRIFINATEKKIICTAGVEAGNPKLMDFYMYNLEGNLSRSKVEGITLQNDDLCEQQINDNWIVYVDSKRTGGGFICLYNRQTSRAINLKEYKGAIPRLSLYENNLVWSEQVGTNVDSIYFCDLTTKEIVSIALQKDLPFGAGGASIYKDTIVYADIDSRDSQPEDVTIKNRSAIKTYNIKTGEVSEYQPNMYVFRPLLRDNVKVWIDTNETINATLYISIDNGPAKRIAEDVSGYGIGDGFVAYGRDDGIFAYIVESDSTVRLSKPELKSIFIWAENNNVLWYDMTEDFRQRDIVKYILLEKELWQQK